MSDAIEPEVTGETGGESGDATPATNGTPWDGYLANVSEPVRPVALEALKYAEGLTTPKFQEHAKFRKEAEQFKEQWSPYAELGITDWDPDGLRQGLQILEQIESKEAGPAIVRRLAEHHGLQIADPDEFDEFDDGDDAGTAPDVEQLLAEKLSERLGPIEQRFQQQDAERAQQQAAEQVASEVKAIEQEIERDLTPDEQQAIGAIAAGFVGQEDQPIAKAWELLKTFTSNSQKQLLEMKRKEPGQAEIAGSSPAQVGVSTDMADAKNEVLAALRASA